MTDARRQADQSLTSSVSENDSPENCSRPSIDEFDEQALADLFAEFADEDRALANLGLADYAGVLSSLDKEP